MTIPNERRYTKYGKIVNLLKSNDPKWIIDAMFSNVDVTDHDLKGLIIVIRPEGNHYGDRRFVTDPKALTEDDILMLVTHSPLTLQHLENPSEKLRQLHLMLHVL